MILITSPASSPPSTTRALLVCAISPPPLQAAASDRIARILSQLQRKVREKQDNDRGPDLPRFHPRSIFLDATSKRNTRFRIYPKYRTTVSSGLPHSGFKPSNVFHQIKQRGCNSVRQLTIRCRGKIKLVSGRPDGVETSRERRPLMRPGPKSQCCSQQLGVATRSDGAMPGLDSCSSFWLWQ